jgi:hypothetical protein
MATKEPVLVLTAVSRFSQNKNPSAFVPAQVCCSENGYEQNHRWRLDVAWERDRVIIDGLRVTMDWVRAYSYPIPLFGALV